MRPSILYQKWTLLGGVGCLVALSLFTVWAIKSKEALDPDGVIVYTNQPNEAVFETIKAVK